MIIFACFCFGIYVLSWFAEKKDSKVLLLATILAAGLLSGFRAGSVGWDTQNYLNIADNVGQGIWSPNVELSFQYIVKALLLLWGDPQWVLLVFAVATNALFLYRFWTLRRVGSFSCMVLLYLIFHYSSTMNIMRQYLAVAVIFFATVFLDKGRFAPYLLCTIFASLLHTTAVLGFVLLPFYVFVATDNKQVRRYILLLCALLLPIIFVGGVVLIHQYGKYLQQANNSIGFMLPVRLLVLVVVWYVSVCKTRSVPYVNQRIMPAIAICAVLGILITFGGYYVTTLSRVGLYFIVFEIPFIAFAMKYGKNRLIPQTLYSVLAAYVLFFALMGNGAGIWPFAFC